MLLNANDFYVHLIMYMNKLGSWTSDTALEISHLRSDIFHHVLQCAVLYTLFIIACYLHCRVLVKDSSPLFIFWPSLFLVLLYLECKEQEGIGKERKMVKEA